VTVFSSPHEYSTATGHQKEADGPFLHRILVGLIAATVISGVVTVALTSQHEPVERFEMANVPGPV
jgi:hypothetical protein